MTITATGLTRAAGIAAAVAGAIFIAVQINHPPMAHLHHHHPVGGPQTAKTVMAALALAGITGMYLRQFRQTGLLGLRRLPRLRCRVPGHVLRRGHRRRTCCPTWSHTEPGFVNDVVAAATGETPHGDIGGIQTLLSPGVGYILAAASSSASPCSAPASSPAGRPSCSPSAPSQRSLCSPTGLVQPAARRPRGHRAHRPRRVPVAQPPQDQPSLPVTWPSPGHPSQSDDLPAAGRPAPPRRAGRSRPRWWRCARFRSWPAPYDSCNWPADLT